MAMRTKCYRTGKDGFPSQLDADLDRIRIESNAKHHQHAPHREVPVRAYHCEFCRQWHNTSQSKRQENESRIAQ